MHKATLAGNPVRKYRTQLQLTMHDFAAECRIGYAAMCAVEGAVYESVPPAVVTYLSIRIPEFDTRRLNYEYSMFQRDLRRINFSSVDLSLPEPDMRVNPVKHYREHMQFGYAEFYKMICVNPGVMYRVEHDKYANLPGQLRSALQDIDLAEDDIEELDFRVTERYESVRHKRRRI